MGMLVKRTEVIFRFDVKEGEPGKTDCGGFCKENGCGRNSYFQKREELPGRREREKRENLWMWLVRRCR